jgi:hypothetical protein
LHEVGALPVPVSGGAFGVDGDRPLAGGEALDGVLQRLGSCYDRGNPIPRFQ